MKKPSNTGASLRTRTASWQYDSMDKAEGMDNDSNHPSYKKLTKYSGNQHGGAAEGNFGRGATRGNTNATGAGPKTPPVSGVPNFEAAKKSSDSINFGSQVRGQGGSTVKTGRESFDFGRGPTKGNGQ